MPRKKQWVLYLGLQTITGSLSKLQAIQRALQGTKGLQLRPIESADGDRRFVYVEDDDNDASLLPTDHEIISQEQYERECTPKITQQALGQEVI